MENNNETKVVKKRSENDSTGIDILANEKRILEDIEETLEENLTEKAARNNLKISHVKNILKHVVSNADVIAFIKDAEDPHKEPEVRYEPKLTRAKAKLMYQHSTLIPWSKSEPSETELLINGDLQEDSSGDEYVPPEEESETIHLVPQRISVDDSNVQVANEDATTIALRTRSKLDLNTTPLEVIEQNFIPPDIMRDETEEEDAVDDMDQHEVDWKKFLDEFTKPLAEIGNNGDPDEEHDPEYNVLADEALEELDIEELRADRGVKITRKELNQLIVELVDCADNFSRYFPHETSQCDSEAEELIAEEPQPVEIANDTHANLILVRYHMIVITQEQKMVLEDQFRKHIQLLAQHFVLAYPQPEYESNTQRCKDYLHAIKNATMGKSYHANIFIDDAIDIVAHWERIFDCDTPAINEFKQFAKENSIKMKQAIQRKLNFTPYFHELTLETISNSEVFLYPSLLPRIPYTCDEAILKGFTNAEIQLLCLGLEQFVPYFKMNPDYLKQNGDLNLKEVCLVIKTYMMPARKHETIYKFICTNRRVRTHPIYAYFDNGHIEEFIHEVTPITNANRLPPCKRRADQLHFQWQHYIHPNLAPEQRNPPIAYIDCQDCSGGFVNKVNKPQEESSRKRDKNFVKQTSWAKELQLCIKFTSSIIINCPILESMEKDVEKGINEEEVTSTQRVDTNLESTDEKDNLEDINALVVASSTIKPASSTTKRRQTVLEKKRAKMKRNFEENMKLLADESPDVIVEKRNRFIQAYYDKVQETLELDDFHTFMSILHEFDDTVSSATIIYNRIKDIFGDKHPELLDEFLLFLDSAQAKSVGKLVPYLILSNMSLFLRKVEVFFQDQPPQLRKIFKALTDLSNKSDVSLEHVKQTIVPLLKGNALLHDWFVQIFPGERPPQTLVENGSWEDVILCKDIETSETATLPSTDDPYGGANCVCKCHSADDEAFNARTKHCTHCGAKFMQGGVFLHTTKGLHPVTITFDKDNIDHKARLAPAVKLKRADSTTSKHISPGKESHDETRHTSDEEDKKTAKKGAKTKGKKRRIQSDAKKSSKIRKTKSSPSKKFKTIDETAWEDSGENKASPEPCHSDESECWEDLEMSQDESDCECPEQEQSSSTTAWTREEDKVILKTFQSEEVMEVALAKIQSVLNHRSLVEIQNRFEVLMNFLKTITKSS